MQLIVTFKGDARQQAKLECIIASVTEVYNNIYSLLSLCNFNGALHVLAASPSPVLDELESLANWLLDLQSTAFHKRVTSPLDIYNSLAQCSSRETSDYQCPDSIYILCTYNCIRVDRCIKKFEQRVVEIRRERIHPRNRFSRPHVLPLSVAVIKVNYKIAK